MKQRWEHSPWAPEIRLLNRWARWCINGNQGEIMRLCGLTWAGSPKSIMARIWECGAETEEAVTGYARELPPTPDFDSHEVDRFMVALRPIRPEAYTAILARHARIVHGEQVLIRSEGWIARALYGFTEDNSRKSLTRHCESGYSALRRWLEAAKVRAA